MSIIALIPRAERRMMRKIIQKTRDKNHAHRLISYADAAQRGCDTSQS